MSRRGRTSTPFSLFAFQDIITSVTAIIILLTLILTLELLSRKPARGSESDASMVAELQASIEHARAEIERLEAKLDGQTDNTQELAGFVAAEAEREIEATKQQIAAHQAELKRIEQMLKAAQERLDQTQAKAFEEKDKHADLAELQAQSEKAEAELKRLQSQNRLIYNPDSQAGKQAWLVDMASQRILTAPLEQPKNYQAFESSSDFLRWARGRDTGSEYFVLLVRPSGLGSYKPMEEDLKDAGFDLGIDVIGETQTVIDVGEE